MFSKELFCSPTTQEHKDLRRTSAWTDEKSLDANPAAELVANCRGGLAGHLSFTVEHAALAAAIEAFLPASWHFARSTEAQTSLFRV